jgi:hypothetical protein
MSSINKKVEAEKIYTDGGAIASRITKIQELERTVMSCMLWEDSYSESGVKVADRIKELVHSCKPDAVAKIAISARTDMHLRHVPLFLVRELARHAMSPSYPKLVANTLTAVIQRPDEIAEFMAIYQKDGKQPLSKQVKIGLANAFKKFNEYSLAKYSSEGKEYSLRDVLFLVHGKPADVPADATKYDRAARVIGVNRQLTAGEALYRRVSENALVTPDTWEVELSSGADKAETFVRLMEEGTLGAMAFLRNLRGMKEAKVPKINIKEYAEKVKVDKILPFRFIASARAVPEWEDVIEPMMLRCLGGLPKLSGKTVFIVDISGSMGQPISSKSTMRRYDAAMALVILAKEMCEDAVIYATAGSDGQGIHATEVIPNRKGFAIADALRSMNAKLGFGGIFLKQTLDYVHERELTADRVIVFTDEIDCDHKCNPADAKAFGGSNYIVNIASQRNGIAYNKFTHIDGWSEQVMAFIQKLEA